MIELNDFYNDGHGWICRQCEREVTKPGDDSAGPALYYREGEAEDSASRLETRALAQWADKAHRFLTCPRCGITEAAEIS